MIVDLEIHSKPQIIFKQLLHSEYDTVLQKHKKKKLFKRLGIKS